jgi:hypothetical protein
MTTAATVVNAGDGSGRLRVRVWFGDYPIADYSADRSVAEHYAEAMRRRFYGLRVTVDDELCGSERPVPAERLWTALPPS